MKATMILPVILLSTFFALSQNASDQFDYILNYTWKNGWYWDLNLRTEYEYENGLVTEVNSFSKIVDSNWAQTYQQTLQYNDKGLLIIQIDRSGSGHDSLKNRSKKVYDYDSNSRLSVEIPQEWRDTVWWLLDRYNYEYDTIANSKTKISQRWNYDSLKWYNRQKDIIFYKKNYWDSSLNFSWINQQWEYYGKSLFNLVFDSRGNIISITYVNINAEKSYNIWEKLMVYDEINNLIEEEVHDWRDSLWVKGFRKQYQYDERNNLIEETSFNGQDSIWIGNTKLKYKFNEYDKMIEYESLHFTNNNWSNSQKDTLKYDNRQRPIERTSIKWKNGQWFNDKKVEYFYLTSDVKDEEISKQIAMVILPNPASERLTIQFGVGNVELAVGELEVFDVFGVRVINTLLDPLLRGEVSIDVSGLAAGIYYIRAGDKLSGAFFIKE